MACSALLASIRLYCSNMHRNNLITEGLSSSTRRSFFMAAKQTSVYVSLEILEGTMTPLPEKAICGLSGERAQKTKWAARFVYTFSVPHADICHCASFWCRFDGLAN